MNRIWGLITRPHRVRLTPARVRNLALALVLPLAATAGVLALGGPVERLTAHGPIQTGHTDVACRECHLPAPGTLRQQVQAGLRHAVGLRADKVDFGYAPVSSEACTACHARPNERHPIYRFREPRFQSARAIVDATTCLGCHTEHRAERVAAPLDVCKACHDTLVLKLDPLDRPHEAARFHHFAIDWYGESPAACLSLGACYYHAEDPAQDVRYREMRELLAADPEWHDGEIVSGPS